MSKRIKLDRKLAKPKGVKPKKWSMYPKPLTEMKKAVYSSIERGEVPLLILAPTYNQKRDVVEWRMTLRGDFHVEDLEYYAKNPQEWRSVAEVILSPEEMKSLCEYYQAYKDVAPHEIKAKHILAFRELVEKPT